MNGGWVLWVMCGVGLHLGRDFVSYKALEGFNTKEECEAAAKKWCETGESMFRRDPRATQCWPVGHDPNHAERRSDEF